MTKPVYVKTALGQNAAADGLLVAMFAGVRAVGLRAEVARR
jgi:hypothetical protein